MRLTFDDDGDTARTERHLELAAAGAAFRAAAATRHYGQLLVTQIQANASGRPGPRAPTGDYRRSWGLRLGQNGLAPWAEAGTNKPQGRRLELGFVGTDSLGRTYDQPAYEHVGPAFDKIAPEFEAHVAGGVSGL